MGLLPKFPLFCLVVNVVNNELEERTVELVKKTVASGVNMVRLRNVANDVSPLAREVAATARAAGATIIADGVSVAADLNAAGVHFKFANRHESVSPSMLKGVSAHSVKEVKAACDSGADYILFGAVFPTSTHPGLPGLGVKVLKKAAVAAGEVPVLAIGGINGSNAVLLSGSGVAGVAVIEALSTAPDPCWETRRIKDALQ